MGFKNKKTALFCAELWLVMNFFVKKLGTN